LSGSKNNSPATRSRPHNSHKTLSKPVSHMRHTVGPASTWASPALDGPTNIGLRYLLNLLNTRYLSRLSKLANSRCPRVL